MTDVPGLTRQGDEIGVPIAEWPAPSAATVFAGVAREMISEHVRHADRPFGSGEFYPVGASSRAAALRKSAVRRKASKNISNFIYFV